ncbi:MAG: S8 family peptidase [Geminicoccaceae bacterium]
MSDRFGKRRRHRNLKNGVSAIALVLLAGCGGGASGGGETLRSPGELTESPVSPPSIIDPPVEESAPTARQLRDELAASRTILAVGGDSALAAGATGEGSVVALIDTGVSDIDADDSLSDPTDFNDRLHSASASFAGGEQVAGGGRGRLSHGNRVASLIASARDGRGTVGIAPDVRLMALDADGSCGDLCFRADDSAAALRHAANNGADVVNMSFGGDQPVSFPLDALVAAANMDVIMVAAAGNNPGSMIYPAAHAGNSRLGGHLIAVGSVGADLSLSDFSATPDTPGQAEFFIVAPGEWVNAANATGAVTIESGTSFSAPLVSGAAAVLKARFPWLGGAEIVDLLLSSARDLGESGTDLVYGRGLLDLEAALRPSGALAIPTAGGGGGEWREASVLSLGPAFGDALSGSGVIASALAVDGLGRAYAAGLQQGMRPHNAGDFLESRLGTSDVLDPSGDSERGRAALMGGGLSWSATPNGRGTAFADWRDETAAGTTDGRFGWATGEAGEASRFSFGFNMPAASAWTAGADEDAGLFLTRSAMAQPAGDLAGDGEQIAFSGDHVDMVLHAGDARQGDGSSYMIGTRLRGDGGFAITHSLVAEQGAALGSDGGGAFAGLADSATTQLFGLSFERPAGAWSLRLDTTLGRSEIGGGGAHFGDWSTVWSTAFAASASRRDWLVEGDRFGMAFGQPLRVEEGSVHAELPTSQDADGSLGFTSTRLDATPSGRELRLEFAYDRPLGDNASIQPWLMLRHEPDHVADADDEALAGVRVRLDW